MPTPDTATLTCAAVRIDALAARRAAWSRDCRTAADEGYVVKGALAECGLALRPWQLLGETGGDLIVVGVVDAAAPTPAQRSGFAFATFEVALTAGADLECVLHFMPTLTVRGPRDEHGRRKHFAVDAADGATDPGAAYRDWALDRLSRTVDDGAVSIPAALALKGDVEVTRIVRTQATRKQGPQRHRVEAGADPARRAVRVLATGCRASVTMTVVDAAAARAVMAFGVGQGKAFGYGTLLPAAALLKGRDLAEGLGREAAA